MVYGVFLKGVRFVLAVGVVDLRIDEQTLAVLRALFREQGEDLVRRLRDARQDVDALSREIALVAGLLTPADAPSGLHGCLSRAFPLQEYDVALIERQERFLAWKQSKRVTTAWPWGGELVGMEPNTLPGGL